MNTKKIQLSRVVSKLLCPYSKQIAVSLLALSLSTSDVLANGPYSLVTSPLSSVSNDKQTAVAFGDLDGDGDLDALVGDFAGGMKYWRNDGTKTSPSFTEATMINGIEASFSGLTQMPAMGDIDGDGDIDVAVARQKVSGTGNSDIVYFRNDGNNSFSSFNPTNLPTDTGDVWGTLTFSDVDQDGDDDLFLAEGKGGGLQYFTNDGSGTFSSDTPPSGMPTDLSYPIFAFGDTDGDGDLDMFVGDFDTKFKYYKNNSGTFSEVALNTAFPGSNFTSVTDTNTRRWPILQLEDIDNDGDLDLFVGGYKSSGTLSIDYLKNSSTSISSVSPVDDSTSVGVDSNLSITFSADVNVSSGNITIKKKSDNSTFEQIDVTSNQVTGSNSSTITINPTNSLDYNTEYYALMDATAFVHASSGANVPGISSTKFWNFTTALDTTPPSISANGIMVVAYNTDGDDNFALVAMEDLTAGAKVFITDEGYDDNNFTFSVEEDVFEWKIPTGGISAGTIVRFTNASSTFALEDSNQGTITHSYGSNDMNLAAGEGLHIFQTSNNVYNGTIQRSDGNGGVEAGGIYSFNVDNSTPDSDNDGWLDVGNAHSASKSQVPDNMTVVTSSGGAGNAFGLLSKLDTNSSAGEYNNNRYNGSTTATTRANWITRFHTPANWITNDSAQFATNEGSISSNFSITSTNSDATITASATVDESSMIPIPSTANTKAEKVNVFDFTITDGGTNDTLTTDITKIVINTSGTGPFDKIKWLLNGPDTTDAEGNYSNNTITFSDLNISITDGANETYTLSAYFIDPTGLIDNATFGLSIDGDSDITTDGSKTGMASGQNAVTNSTNAKVDITATKLIFKTLPSN